MLSNSVVDGCGFDLLREFVPFETNLCLFLSPFVRDNQAEVITEIASNPAVGWRGLPEPWPPSCGLSDPSLKSSSGCRPETSACRILSYAVRYEILQTRCHLPALQRDPWQGPPALCSRSIFITWLGLSLNALLGFSMSRGSLRNSALPLPAGENPFRRFHYFNIYTAGLHKGRYCLSRFA